MGARLEFQNRAPTAKAMGHPRKKNQGRVVGVFDRPWFALWDTRAMQGAVAPGCAPYFNDINGKANEIRQGVAANDEAARPRADSFVSRDHGRGLVCAEDRVWLGIPAA